MSDFCGSCLRLLAPLADGGEVEGWELVEEVWIEAESVEFEFVVDVEMEGVEG